MKYKEGKGRRCNAVLIKEKDKRNHNHDSFIVEDDGYNMVGYDVDTECVDDIECDDDRGYRII